MIFHPTGIYFNISEKSSNITGSRFHKPGSLSTSPENVSTAPEEGIYINYAFPECEDYGALAVDKNGIKIAIKKVVEETEETAEGQIETNLKNLGLQTPRHFEIETIEN